MADIKSPEARSRNMAKIRSTDTKPEVWLRKQLFSIGYRYRKNVKTVPGHPDIWLGKYHAAIFVHGCFWHRHEGCKYAYMPKSCVEFWSEKFRRNMARDHEVMLQLNELGIRTVIVWECTIVRAMKSSEEKSKLMQQLHEFLISEDRKLVL